MGEVSEVGKMRHKCEIKCEELCVSGRYGYRIS